MTNAHIQAVSHHYYMHYPDHPARTDDPHYKDFNHFHRLYRATGRCYLGDRLGFSDCKDSQGKPAPVTEGLPQAGLELHHAHIEFSLQQGVNLNALNKDYPGVGDPDTVGAWVESAANLIWLCAWHHRGAAGVHTASYSDWEGSKYILGLITGEPTA
jgi:hypothetical protein